MNRLENDKMPRDKNNQFYACTTQPCPVELHPWHAHDGLFLGRIDSDPPIGSSGLCPTSRSLLSKTPAKHRCFSETKPAIDHGIARVVDRRFAFGSDDKEQFRIYMRMMDGISDAVAAGGSGSFQGGGDGGGRVAQENGALSCLKEVVAVRPSPTLRISAVAETT